MKFTAGASVNMARISLIDPGDNETISAGSDKLVLFDRFGNKQEYLGDFLYNGEELDYESSTLTGFKQYEGLSVYWSATFLSISGAKFQEFDEADNFAGLMRYALREDDEISGSKQADVLLGGAGKDTIIGRGGADRFVYNAVSDSKAGVNTSDSITDFKRAERDKIDLSKIDADPNRSGDQQLTFIGNKQFTGAAGEVRFSGGILEVDTNRDKTPDMQILLSGIKDFRSSSLIL